MKRREVAVTVLVVWFLVLALSQAFAQAPGMDFVADVTISDDAVMEPGQEFTKTWKLKNSGDVDWTEEYKLVFVEGAQLGAVSPQSIPTVIKPGETADISVNMVAPETDGSYTSWWCLVGPAGNTVGDKFYVRILVGVTAQERVEYAKRAQDVTLKMAEKSPKKYEGQVVCWKGKIFKIEEEDARTFLQAWYNNTMDAFVAFYEGSVDVYRDDEITVCGEFAGTFEGRNAFGAQVRQPRIDAKFINKVVWLPPPTPTPTATPVVVEYPMNHKFTVGHWDILVQDVFRNKQVWASSSRPITASGIFALTRINVTNNTGSTTNLSAGLACAYMDSAGNVYDDDELDVTWAAIRHFGNSVASPYADIQPGAPDWPLLVAFEVPEETAQLWLTVMDRESKEMGKVRLQPLVSKDEQRYEGEFINAPRRE